MDKLSPILSAKGKMIKHKYEGL